MEIKIEIHTKAQDRALNKINRLHERCLRIICNDKTSPFKACLRYFLSNFYFLPNESPSKNMKNVFLFHLKIYFHSWDIQVFSSSPLVLSVSHCFKGWSQKNLKVYDATNCLYKNLIIHFVWYLEKEIRCHIETLSIIRVSNKEHFNGKIMQKMCTSN